jgi:3-methyladenine DNA glycosylase AlkD
LNVSELAAVLHARLADQGSAERADGERRYLRSELTHLGVAIPVLRRTTGQVLREQRLTLTERVALAEELWRHPIHELRRAAVEVLARSAGELDTSHLTLLERLVRESRTWALVDPLAVTVTGTILRHHPDAGAALDRWIADADFWVRRAALLAHLGPLRADPGRELFAAFAAHADRVLDEREGLDRGSAEVPARVSPEAKFFIRKAIGWVLRETGRRAPELVIEWLAPRTQRASGVTMREAVKYLPSADAERLMDAYRAGIPATASGR